MGAPYTYDPKKVAVIVAGVPMGGFADGSFITAERTNDSFSKVSGSDGIVSRAKSNDKSGSIKITLQQTSPSNDVLAGIQLLDEMTNTGIVPVIIQDFSGRSTFVSAFAWIKKPPAGEFTKEISNREWEFECADIDLRHGGNVGID
jgi:hypothetical protein